MVFCNDLRGMYYFEGFSYFQLLPSWYTLERKSYMRRDSLLILLAVHGTRRYITFRHRRWCPQLHRPDKKAKPSFYPYCRGIKVSDHAHTWSVADKKYGNHCIKVMKNPYLKLIKVKRSTRTTATAIATVFLDQWTLNFGVLSTITTNNDPLFPLKCFKTVCRRPRTILLMTKKCNL